MKPGQHYSDEYLNAFVDGEISQTERARTIEQISGDELLKKQVCELHMLKEMVRSGYRHEEVAAPAERRRRRWPHGRQALAACCLIVVGLVAGWLGRGLLQTEDPYMHVASLKDVIADSGRVVLHVDTASVPRFRRALDRTEALLAEAKREGRPLEVHLAANSYGLDLFRTSTSPFAARLHEMQEKYPNLSLIGCGQTIRRLKERHQDAALLPDVHVVPAVLDEVVHDLKTGWTYIKV